MPIITNTFAWYFPILGIFAYLLIQKKKKYANEQTLIGAPYDYDISYDFRVSIGFAILVFLPMILISGFSNGMADTYLYIGMFKQYPASIDGISDYLSRGEKGPGFIVFSIIIKHIFGSDYRPWLFIIASIQGLCLALTFRKYTSEIVYCAFAFFASTAYMAWMNNGIRQFLVAAILFASFPLLQKKKFSRLIIFICIWICMIYFHTSAIIVFPLYLVALGKPFNKLSIFVILLAVLAVVFVSTFTGILDNVLEGTEYAHVTDNMSVSNGQNPLRMLFSSVPAIIAVVFRKKIPNDVPEIISTAINMSLITFSLDIISVFTSGIMLGRLPIYFSLFNYILFPWEIKTFFPKRYRTLIYCIWVIVFITFFFYQMYVWGWWN